MGLIKAIRINSYTQPYAHAVLRSIGLMIQDDRSLHNQVIVQYETTNLEFEINSSPNTNPYLYSSSLRAFNSIVHTQDPPTELVSKIDLLSVTASQLLTIFNNLSPSDDVLIHKKTPAFSYRVDSDGFNLTSVEKTLELSHKAGFPFTWFVDVAPAIGSLDFYKRASESNQDIQLHCYNHLFQPNAIKFRRDVLQGRNILEDLLSKKITGYSGPSGRYTLKNYKVLQDLGFLYTSDFSFAYDFPLFSIPSLSLVQLPIYPFSIGSSISAGWDPKLYVKHMKEYVHLKFLQGQDVILYGHPENRIELYQNQLIEIFDYVKSLGFEFLTIDKLFDRCVSNNHRSVKTSSVINKLWNMANPQRIGSFNQSLDARYILPTIIYKTRTTDFPFRSKIKAYLFVLKESLRIAHSWLFRV